MEYTMKKTIPFVIALFAICGIAAYVPWNYDISKLGSSAPSPGDSILFWDASNNAYNRTNLADLITTGGAAYVNGGNDFGSNASIGLNDGNYLDFETNGVARVSLGGGGRFHNRTLTDFVFAPTDTALLMSGSNGWLMSTGFARLVSNGIISFQANGSTGALAMNMPDNVATGLQVAINGGGNALTVATTDGSELVTLGSATMPCALYGTATNNSASAGQVGEYVSSLVSAGVTLSNNTTKNVDTLSLTAGDWDVEGNVNYIVSAGTVTATSAGITSTSATIPSDGTEVYDGNMSTLTSFNNSVTLPRKRISVTSTTNVYLVARMSFSAGSVTVTGSISARRVR